MSQPEQVPPGTVEAVVALMQQLIPEIPLGTAATVGRPPGPPAPITSSWDVPMPHPSIAGMPHPSIVAAALQGVSTPTCDRVFGAIETTLDRWSVPLIHGLSPSPPSTEREFAVLVSRGAPGLLQAMSLLARTQPGLDGAALAVAEQVCGTEPITLLLTTSSTSLDEKYLAGEHGARYLALGVAVAALVLKSGAVALPAEIVGPQEVVAALGIGIAAHLLAAAPLPKGYPEAMMEKRRREYLRPRASTHQVQVLDHVVALLEEGAELGSPDFSENGLVAALDGGLAIHTGRGSGEVRLDLRVDNGPPNDDMRRGGQEIVDVSWTAHRGWAFAPGMREGTPPWPGTYRARVTVGGRDRDDDHIDLDVWTAPLAAPQVRKLTDRVGAALRGDIEAAKRLRPDDAYQWIRRSGLGVAATVTVVPGGTVAKTLQAFEADPTPIPMSELLAEYGQPPSVGLVQDGDTVFAVEINGWQGSTSEVLGRLSAEGIAGSIYWSVNRSATLSIARGGEVLALFEFGIEDAPDVAEIGALLEGLDPDDFGNLEQQVFVALERFTGRRFRPEHLATLERGVGHRIPESAG